MISNNKSKVFTRRQFFNYLLSVIAVPALLWWLFVGKRDEKLRQGDENIIIGKVLPVGISFFGSAILVNKNKKVTAYEAKCTHLGCQINKSEGEELVCQCHGSRFDLAGMPVKGPAGEALRELAVIRDNEGIYIIITGR